MGLNPPPTPLAKPCALGQAASAQTAHSSLILIKAPVDCGKTQLSGRGAVGHAEPTPLPSRCCECSASLSHQYYEKDGQLFCKKDYWTRYGESCHGCSEHITKGLVMVSAPACLSHLTWCVCVCVHVLTGFSTPDLSPITSLIVLFTGSLTPPCLLNVFVYLCPSASYL